jgi:cobalt/nickel transport system permease protein
MSCSLARQIDLMGYGSSPIHKINPAAKIIVTLVFVIIIASYPKYTVLSLLPYFLLPLFFGVAGKVRLLPILKAILILLPFAVAPALLNPFFDKNVVYLTSTVSLSAGWLSLFSAVIRFILSLAMVLILAATTSMVGIIAGLKTLGLPETFINQLHILYRYLFLLIEEGATMQHARLLREPHRRLPTIHTAGRMIAALTLKAYERAERIYAAIQLKAHNGVMEFYTEKKWQPSDIVFVALWCGVCLIQRFFWFF